MIVLQQINQREWAAYEWVEATELSSQVRVFMRGRERTPEEAAIVTNLLAGQPFWLPVFCQIEATDNKEQ